MAAWRMHGDGKGRGKSGHAQVHAVLRHMHEWIRSISRASGRYLCWFFSFLLIQSRDKCMDERLGVPVHGKGWRMSGRESICIL